MATNFSDLLNKQSNTSQEAATSNIPANEKLTAAEFIELVRAVRDNSAIVDVLKNPNKIIYTSTNGRAIELNYKNVFGANIISNTYENGRGVILFDGPVTTIGEYAFDSSEVKSIIIPDSVTSIGDFAFSYSSLADIYIPNSVKSIGRYVFSATYNLENITIPGSVASISEGLFEYSGVKNVTLLEGVTSIGTSAFSSCENLISISLPNSLTSIGSNAFQYSGSLKSISIPDSVTTIGPNAFDFCSSLSSAKLPQYLTVINKGLFDGCNLINILLPEHITEIGENAFYACDKMESIIIPERVTNIGRSVFYNAENLKTVYLKPTAPPTIGETMFHGMSDYTLYVPYESVEAYKTADGWSQCADRIRGYHYDASVAANFIDMLMAGLGTQDVALLANRIIAAINIADPADIKPE